jgi:putative FmdB family regulatory protein
MALYEYQCDACGHRFEIIQKWSDPPQEICPKCGGKVHKMQSAPAFQFKGTGWYVTDYAKKDQGGPAKSSGDSTDSKPSSQSSDRSEKSEKSDKSDKADRSEKSDKGDRSSEKSEKPSETSKGSSSGGDAPSSSGTTPSKGS